METCFVCGKGYSSNRQWCPHCEKKPATATDLHVDAVLSTAAIAYGWLWHIPTEDRNVRHARNTLGEALTDGLKAYGIQAAKDDGAQVSATPWRDVAEELPQEAQEVLFVRGGKTVHGAWIGGIFWHSNQKMAAATWMPLPFPPNN